MINFNKTYDLLIEDIIQSVTPEELKDRQKLYPAMQLKQYFNVLLERNQMKKNDDGTYDIFVDVNIYLEVTSFKGIPYVLNKVKGNFKCSNNALLTSLEGGPKIVSKDCGVYGNRLTNLIGAPEIIGGDFDCSRNALTSLEGCPKEVCGDFWIRYMKNSVIFNKEDIRKVCNVKGYVLT